MLCSDGLSGYVSDADILDLAGNWGPSMASMKLIDRANENGGGDNVTALVVTLSDIQKPPSRLKRWLGRG